MVIWGNERANSYWEAKLEDNYTPSDARVDAFIKAKYVARKWAASTETPDPSTLSVDSQTTIVKTEQPDRTIHADHGPSPERFAQRRLRSPAREIKPQESLLGLDFTTQPQPRASQSREAGSSASCATNVDLLTSTDTPSSGSLFADRHASIKLSEPKPGRNDLKMSIMSLYASAPRSQSLRSHETAPNSMHTSWSAPKRPVADGTSRPGAFDELTGLFGGMNVNSAARGSQALQPSQRPIPQAQSTATRGTTQAQEPLDPWGAYNTDEFGGFQSGAHSPSQTKSNVPVTGAFDDLYSTSDVWK
ncbi:ARF GAP with effector function(s) [Savitreella phatthalungensis]